ncbi:MAG TPA: hypothetical protein PLR88_04960 [Bacteroidales bacterium]|nr:hypothetical protein [Bacteroidales bacterium]
MKKSLTIAFNAWLERILSYPGISPEDLLRKRFTIKTITFNMIAIIIVIAGCTKKKRCSEHRFFYKIQDIVTF